MSIEDWQELAAGVRAERAKVDPPRTPVPDDNPADYQHTALSNLARDWWAPPPELIATLPRGGVQLSYLGHADTTRALIEADPCWTWEPMGYDDHGQPIVERDGKGNAVGMWCWLTVCGVRRPAYGSCDPGKRDAVKELIGDAIRNGAMRFGVAGSLWSKADREGDKPAPAMKRSRKAASQPRSNTDLPAAEPAPVPGTAELKALHLLAGEGVTLADVADVLKAEGIGQRAMLTDPATMERAQGIVAAKYGGEK